MYHLQRKEPTIISTLLLSRIQFGFTVGFHFIFPPLTIGLSWFVFGLMTSYRTTGLALYREMTKFWIRMLGATFVIGAATGIAMEFQFGTNWAGYSRFVGDIFGAPLAIEAVVAFFLESTFLAILLFAWDRVSARAMWAASLLVALGSTLSAFWILVANSWQQTPAGYTLAGGHARLTSFGAAVFTASMWPRFLHTTCGALATASFFVLGIGAAYLLRGRHIEFAKRCVAIAIVGGFIFSVGQFATGHVSGRQVAATQPAKLAAFEGHFTTCTGAPMIVIGVPKPESCTTRRLFVVPKLLSYLAYGDANAQVKGLTDFPVQNRPPVWPTFLSFHLMVVIGLGLIGLTALGVLLLWRYRIEDARWFLRLAVIAIPFPFIANELGWMVAEIGRQPWVVYNVLKTSDAVSTTVPASQVWISGIFFVLIYALLFAGWIYVLRRIYLEGPADAQTNEVTA